jgi:phosphatidate cytidylyltransferase
MPYSTLGLPSATFWLPSARTFPVMAAPRTFLSRLTSTLILWAVIAAAIRWQSQTLFASIAAFFGIASAFEYYRLLRSDQNGRPFHALGLLISLGYWGYVSYHVLTRGTEPPMWLDLAALTLSVQGAFVLSYRLQLEGDVTLQRIFSNVFGTVYTVIFFGFIVRLMYFRADGNGASGLFLMLYLVMVTKFTDMGAYAIGSLIGKHKMIPHISPAKSWEGFGGAFLGALLATAVMLTFFPEELVPLNWMHGLILVPIIGLAAIIGDLAESVLKRCVQIKDSGHTLPGIGGVLDLTDSLLFTAPLFYFYLRFITSETLGS